jgi:D-aminoacyl-tRNA deacylase
MKLVIQRVNYARVRVDNETISEIGKGMLVFLGISNIDNGEEIDWLSKKLIEMRIFGDDKGKMNLSVQDVKGEILLVSQFTLYADNRKGRRPEFNSAAKPEIAEEFYHKFADVLEKKGVKPELGQFAAHMEIYLENDGPVTIILER